MSSDFPNNYADFAFVIDTAEYAGNFERQMCAYLTGRVGECGVGKELADLAEPSEVGFENVVDVPDDHGCFRPSSIYLNKGRYSKKECNSVVIYFSSKPTKKQITLMKKRAAEFSDKKLSWCHQRGGHKLRILGFSILRSEYKIHSTEV